LRNDEAGTSPHNLDKSAALHRSRRLIEPVNDSLLSPQKGGRGGREGHRIRVLRASSSEGGTGGGHDEGLRISSKYTTDRPPEIAGRDVCFRNGDHAAARTIACRRLFARGRAAVRARRCTWSANHVRARKRARCEGIPLREVFLRQVTEERAIASGKYRDLPSITARSRRLESTDRKVTKFYISRTTAYSFSRAIGAETEY